MSKLDDPDLPESCREHYVKRLVDFVDYTKTEIFQNDNVTDEDILSFFKVVMKFQENGEMHGNNTFSIYVFDGTFQFNNDPDMWLPFLWNMISEYDTTEETLYLAIKSIRECMDGSKGIKEGDIWPAPFEEVINKANVI